jgi:hypothetical protein
MGDPAITLERLTTRDGYTTHEAIELMTTGNAPAASRQELEAILLRLPPRSPRPVLISDDDAPDVATNDDPSELAMSGERATHARRAAKIVDELMQTFEPEERLILKLRFWNARRVADIAETLHLDQKKTYKRIDKLLARLRGALEQAGVSREVIDDLLAHDRVVEIASMRENPPTRPSNGTAGDTGGGESRLSG